VVLLVDITKKCILGGVAESESLERFFVYFQVLVKNLHKDGIKRGQFDKEYTVRFHQIGIGGQDGKDILGKFTHIVRS
jgi:hypothetical protein